MLDEQLELFERWARRRRKSANTISQYSSQLRSFAERQVRTDDLYVVTREQIEAYVRAMSSNHMRSRFLCAAHLFFKHALGAHKVDSDPSAYVHFAVIRVSYPSDAEIMKVLSTHGVRNRRLGIADILAIARDERCHAELRAAATAYLEGKLGGRSALRSLLTNAELPLVAPAVNR